MHQTYMGNENGRRKLSAQRWLCFVFCLFCWGPVWPAGEGLKWPAAHAEEAVSQEGLWAALENGTPYIDLRYRLEWVDQKGLPENARASTLRTRFGYRSGWYHDFQALLEAEDVRGLGGETYNNTYNGKTARPVVADPEDAELNQGYLAYRGLPGVHIAVGRQKIVFDNQRFIGNVGFRQNEQTFDAAAVTYSGVEDLTAAYAYLDNVNRVFGDHSPVGDHRMHSHLLNGKWKFSTHGTLSAYGYFLDYEKFKALSSDTLGVRASSKMEIEPGKWFLYALEYAHQDEGENNPASFGLEYYLIEAGVTAYGGGLKLGYEVLEGDGTNAFQTPLATLHGFQGWADKFLVTPPGGLENLYVVATASLWEAKLILAYQDFEGESAGGNLGHEWDAEISRGFADHYTLSLRAAFYESGGAATGLTDTRKIWLTMGVSY